MQVADERAPATGKPRFIALNRAQSYWGEIDLERLIEADHPARAIWALTGRLDLGRFEEGIRSREGTAGAPRHSPRLLVSVWVYAYSQGIASARALERMMSYEPGLRWLCADEAINYHTLADFRSSQKEKLNDLFAKVLAVMDEEGLIDLRTLMQDGTKVRAVASKWSLHREGTLRNKWEQARALVEELEKQSEKESGENEEKGRTAARRRAAQERVQRMESSLEELRVRQESVAAGKRGEVRISDSEPEARKMLQSDGGFAPSYNVQITTEAKSKMVVGMGVVNEANDTHQLVPALDQVRERFGTQPEQMVADGGYATRENVEVTESRQVQLVAPWKDDASREAGARKTNELDPEFAPSKFQMMAEGDGLQCPAGNVLVQIKTRINHGQTYGVFQARQEHCAACQHQARCLKKDESARRVERVCESDAMKAYLARQQQPTIQELYRRRKAVAEFPQLRFKGNWGLRQFSVRGLDKVNREAIWIALAYNVSQWFRLHWIPRLATI